jgi:hypothetical protein
MPPVASRHRGPLRTTAPVSSCATTTAKRSPMSISRTSPAGGQLQIRSRATRPGGGAFLVLRKSPGQRGRSLGNRTPNERQNGCYRMFGRTLAANSPPAPSGLYASAPRALAAARADLGRSEMTSHDPPTHARFGAMAGPRKLDSCCSIGTIGASFNCLS